MFNLPLEQQQNVSYETKLLLLFRTCFVILIVVEFRIFISTTFRLLSHLKTTEG